MFAFMQESGLLPANEHPAPFTIEPMRTSNVELIATVHRLPIGIIADKPSQGRNPLGCGLHVYDPFNDATHIVSVTDDAMELERMLSRVAPDGSGIGMPCILSKIIQAHPSSAQEGQAGTPTAMPGDFPGGILSVDASPCAEGRDQRVVDEARADSQLL